MIGYKKNPREAGSFRSKEREEISTLRKTVWANTLNSLAKNVFQHEISQNVGISNSTILTSSLDLKYQEKFLYERDMAEI